jgi:L-arabinokinase
MNPPPAPTPARDDPTPIDAVALLARRITAELAASFDPARPARFTRAPGRLDVMGGIADYTGSMVCEYTLGQSAAVALAPRDDRNVQVFSFNLLDENQPFTMSVPLEALTGPLERLRRDFQSTGRKWGGYFAGCLAVLHEQQLIDLTDPRIGGLNMAVLSQIPLGAGVSSSAAIEVATMMNLAGHFGLLEGRSAIQPLDLASMCQRVENHVVGAPCGIMDQVSSCCGRAGSLLRLICQPHKLLPPLPLPAGVKVVGINTNVRHSVGGGMYGRTRCAAFMGHRIILDKMRQIGIASGRTLTGDPTGGYLANVDASDYREVFRPVLPEWLEGEEFLSRYDSTIDTATVVDPAVRYHVRQATDHHVLEAGRVRHFVELLEEAASLDRETAPWRHALRKAGHLMYASHQSYTQDAMLGADECDLLVELARNREGDGIFGAKITGGGSGGTVAILAEDKLQVDDALAEMMREYQARTGRVPHQFRGASDGAWPAGGGILKPPAEF